MVIFHGYVSLPEGTQAAFGGWNSLVSSMQISRRWVMFPPDVPAESIGACLGSMAMRRKPPCGCGSKWKTDVGPQIEMSSLVFTIQLLGYLILTHTHVTTQKMHQLLGCNLMLNLGELW